MLKRLIKLLLAIVYYGLRQIACLACLLGKEKTGGLLVVTYHAVKDGEVKKFERQMDALLKAGVPVAADSADVPNDGTKAIAVTFDDGYSSVVKNAVPTMIRRRIPATLFVVTGYLGGRPGWIKDMRHRNADEILISFEDIEGIPKSLLSVGSHSVTHRRLAGLTEEEIREELICSKAVLERALNRPVTTLSLPYGSRNTTVLELARDAGYRRVFLDDPLAWNGNRPAHLYGRIDVYLDDWFLEYWLKFRGAYDYLGTATVYKKRLQQLFQGSGRQR